MNPFSRRSSKRKSVRKHSTRRRYFESLETRSLLTTFTVLNTNDRGSGSLRQAIIDSNFHLGADTIAFATTGTISLRSALPTIFGTVDINGQSAPGYSGTPKVKVDFNNRDGLRFNTFADGSKLRGLSLIDAGNSAITLVGTNGMLIVGNYIGVGLDGTSVTCNDENGILLLASHDNTIGGTTAQDRNVISGNRGNGIELIGSRRDDILGNYIGVDSTGQFDRGNSGSGIVITALSYKAVIGGGSQNVISGNDGNGILINGLARLNTIDGNLIGTDATGQNAIGNRHDGIRLQSTDHNVIGHENIITGSTFYNSQNGTDLAQPVNGWQGIRAGSTAVTYILTGTTGSSSLVYIGSIDGNNGTSYTTFNYPSPPSTESTLYSGEDLGGGVYRFVGTYQTASSSPVAVNSYMFEGALADAGDASHYRTINYPGAKYTYAHSTMGGLVVGNYTKQDSHGHLDPGHAFIYDIANDKFLPDVKFPGSKMNSAYGIWSNGGTKYTIVGGYSNGIVPVFEGKPFGTAYMVDFDSATQKFSNWKSFMFPDGHNLITHFQGISSVEPGVYTLSSMSAQLGTSNLVSAQWVVVNRNSDGSFSDGLWGNIQYPNASGITTNDSVYGNQIVGVVIGDGISYQATIDTGFQLSNVISGNGGNGIAMSGAFDNHVAMNYIGTDIDGMAALGNGGHGVLISSFSTNNLIGGTATGGNSPVNDVFVQPPQGNVISGNSLDGVHISGHASFNQLSGNFIGVDGTGNAALGNHGDGVAIVGADHNSLLGCTFEQDPFVYYNVVSGNLKNGLRVDSSDYTTIQANFFGMGSNNVNPVGNGANGVLVEGNSRRTTMGGPIPLGNVSAANGENGIFVRGTASYFISYNTFAGLAAFSNETTNGNHQDGIKITSTGGNNYLRTNVVSNNQDDGIDIGGNASGVRITGNIVGMNTYGFSGMGNFDNGIEIGETAHDILIGGPQPVPNVIPQNTISDNGNNGIAVLDQAHNITINCSIIGLDVVGAVAFGNNANGVYLAKGTHDNTIGSSATVALRTVISGNDGNGIEIDGDHNTVLGTRIGTNPDGTADFGNFGNGILIRRGGSHNLIGSRTSDNPGNTIGFNDANGVRVVSGNSNAIRRNSIFDNAILGISLENGANRNQAAPLLTTALQTPTLLQVSGKLTSRANTTYTLDFFANDSSAPEGQTYLGSKTVKTNKKGVGKFVVQGGLPPAGTTHITATATSVTQDTSEFSNSALIIDVPDFTPGIYLLRPSW